MTCGLVRSQPSMGYEQPCLLKFTNKAWVTTWYGIYPLYYRDHLAKYYIMGS